jgi:hypothetical protein
MKIVFYVITGTQLSSENKNINVCKNKHFSKDKKMNFRIFFFEIALKNVPSQNLKFKFDKPEIVQNLSLKTFEFNLAK